MSVVYCIRIPTCETETILGLVSRRSFGASIALVLLAGCPVAPVASECGREGDPAFYIGFGADLSIVPGGTVLLTVAPANFAMASAVALQD